MNVHSSIDTETVPLPAGHPAVKPRRIGVLLTNLGTPDATDYWSMRRYLKEFLSDRRVIEVNRVLWWAILNGIILTVRPGKKGKDYETIWNRELNESPLKTITRSQTEKLQARVKAGALGPEGRDVIVDWGMRYGNPSVRSAWNGCRPRGATASCWCRSTRNMPPPRAPRPATRLSRR